MAQRVKNLPAMQETQEMQVLSLEEKWQPIPVFLPGKSHGQRSLWATVHGVAESNIFERLSFFHWVAQMVESACNAGDLGLIPELGRCPGGGHGKPLQYSCLENPMDRGACGLQSTASQRARHD